MTKNEAIEEYLEIIENIYQNYCNRPTWDKLQDLFWNIYQLGKETGKQQVIQNLERNKDKDEEDPVARSQSESKRIIDNLCYGRSTLEFKSADEARTKFNMLRKYSQYHKLGLKFKVRENVLYITRS